MMASRDREVAAAVVPVTSNHVSVPATRKGSAFVRIAGHAGGVPPLTARQLNRATLARQLLLAREPLGVVDAVRRIVALQAQEAASPYIALWNRVAGFDPGRPRRARSPTTRS